MLSNKPSFEEGKLQVLFVMLCLSMLHFNPVLTSWDV